MDESSLGKRDSLEDKDDMNGSEGFNESSKSSKPADQ